MKKIISLILFFSILFSIFSISAFADDSSYTSPSRFWNWVAENNEFFQHLLGYFPLTSTVCAESPDGHHHAGSFQKDLENGYFNCVCSYCGDYFKAYEDELEQGYNDYVTNNNLHTVTPGRHGHWKEDCPYLLDTCSNYSLVGTLSNGRNYEYYSDYIMFGTMTINDPSYNLGGLFISEYPYHERVYTGEYNPRNYNIEVNGVKFIWTRSSAISQGTITYSKNPILDLENYIVNNATHIELIIEEFYDFDNLYYVPENININNNSYTVQNFDFSTRTFTILNYNGDVVSISYGDTEYTITNYTTNITETYNYYGSDPAIPSGEDNSENWSYLFRWLTEFKQWLGEKIDGITGGTTIIENFTETVNNTDITYINSEGEEQKTSVKRFFSKFLWVKDVYSVGRSLVSVVSTDAANAYSFDLGSFSSGEDPGTELTVMNTSSGDDLSSAGAPVVYVDLSAANSNYGIAYGGRVQILNLSWYTPYKSSVDNIVSGFLWLLFVWRLFSKAPGIISGSSLDSAKLDDIDNGERKGKK